MSATPHIITLAQIGDSVQGYISIAEVQKNIPFEIKRVYWTYYTPQNVIRGKHAHRALHQIIFAVSGKIIFETENIHLKKEKFILENPNEGLYLPPYTWREIQFSHNAVLLCLASDFYDEQDYIRNYDDFKLAIDKNKQL